MSILIYAGVALCAFAVFAWYREMRLRYLLAPAIGACAAFGACYALLGQWPLVAFFAFVAFAVSLTWRRETKEREAEA